VIDAQGRTMAMGAEALPLAIELLLAGRILAIKGIGGFHLAVNARDHQAVALLRQRKQRERKPFALMASDVSTVRKLVDCGPEAADLLSSPTAPIVLLEKLPAVDVLSPEIAPANPSLGIMLPYSPLHELLFRHPASAGRLDLLVMTSGNISDEPIQYENQSAVATLQSLADAFLLHNRDIVVRSDDSIFQVSRGCPVPIRIARGVIPSPLPIKSAERVVVGVGAELKNAVFFLSPAGGYLTSHIGDLKTLAAYEGFRTAIAQYETFFNLSPDAAGYDLHPDFLSTRWVRDESGLPAVAVQHHHAHIAALMAEHGLAGPLLGIALDGTGLGSDGQIWGGEFLVCTRSAYERVGHLRPFPLPGGEAAIRSPARIAWACWQTMCSEHWPNIAGPALGLDGTMQRLLDRMLDSGTNCPQTTSAGRLFDAVSAYLGLCHRVTYEGEAAIALEAAAAMVWRKPNGRYTFAIHTDKMPFVLDPEPMWRAIAADRRRGVPVEIMAQRFISGLANGCAELAARLCRRFHLTAVAISGGVCQNRLLMDELHRLDWSDLTLYVHRLLPPNDACIAVGQAVVAEEVLRNVSSRSNAFAGDQTGQSGNS